MALFTGLSVVIGIFAHELLDYLHLLVGGAMLIYGIEGVLFPISREKKKFFHDYQLYLGAIEILLGIVMISLIRDFNTICVMWGTWTIVRESYEIYETSHKFVNGFPAILSLSLSFVEIVFSILLILFASEHHALTHVYLLIPELIINGASPLLFDIYESYKSKKK